MQLYRYCSWKVFHLCACIWMMQSKTACYFFEVFWREHCILQARNWIIDDIATVFCVNSKACLSLLIVHLHTTSFQKMFPNATRKCFPMSLFKKRLAFAVPWFFRKIYWLEQVLWIWGYVSCCSPEYEEYIMGIC